MPTYRVPCSICASVRRDFPNDHLADQMNVYAGTYEIWSYAKFPVRDYVPPLLGGGPPMTRATIHLYDCVDMSGGPVTVNMAPMSINFDINSVTWNSKPSTAYEAAYSAVSWQDSGLGFWRIIDITGMIDTVMNNNGYSYGVFSFRPLNAKGATAYYGNSARGFEPYIEVVINDAPYAPANLGFGWNTTDWRWFNTNPQVTWNFSDPNAGDYQAQFHVQRTTDARGWGSPDYDTGGVASGNTWHDITWSNQGTNYVRVRTADQYGAWSDWSYKTYQCDTVAPGASSVQATSSQAIQPNNSFRVHAFGIGDDRSGIAKVEFPTAGPGYDWQWRNGANAGNGTWFCDIPINAYNNNEGTYTTHVYVTDVAGNRAFVGAVSTNVDRTRATDPNVLAASVRSTSATLTWNGFSDPGASSGYLRTQLYVRKNGAANSVDIDGNGSIEDFITFTDNRTSYTVNGLLENTSYAFVVTHYDQAGNESNYTWKWLNSNSRPTANLLNLASAGYVLNQRPKIRVSGSDPEGSALNFNLQISNRSDFTTTLLDVSAVGGTGWSSTGAVSGGVVNTYTPQVDLGIGTRYVRVRAGDGQEWGNWSATISMIIQGPNWPTAVKATDRNVSKRTLDDLRNKVNAIRQQRAMGAIAWTDPAIRDWNDPAGATRIRAVHITELREAMQDVATLFGVTLTWSKADLNGAERNGQEWLDLRNAAMAI